MLGRGVIPQLRELLACIFFQESIGQYDHPLVLKAVMNIRVAYPWIRN